MAPSKPSAVRRPGRSARARLPTSPSPSLSLAQPPLAEKETSPTPLPAPSVIVTPAPPSSAAMPSVAIQFGSLPPTVLAAEAISASAPAREESENDILVSGQGTDGRSPRGSRAFSVSEIRGLHEFFSAASDVPLPPLSSAKAKLLAESLAAATSSQGQAGTRFNFGTHPVAPRSSPAPPPPLDAVSAPDAAVDAVDAPPPSLAPPPLSEVAAAAPLPPLAPPPLSEVAAATPPPSLAPPPLSEVAAAALPPSVAPPPLVDAVSAPKEVAVAVRQATLAPAAAVDVGKLS